MVEAIDAIDAKNLETTPKQFLPPKIIIVPKIRPPLPIKWCGVAEMHSSPDFQDELIYNLHSTLIWFRIFDPPHLAWLYLHLFFPV